jgi:hypothetical protein
MTQMVQREHSTYPRLERGVDGKIDVPLFSLSLRIRLTADTIYSESI